MIVVDLGAAPGSWTEYAVKIIAGKHAKIKPSGKVFALDILPINPIDNDENITYLQGDFTKPEVLAQLSQLIGVTHGVDVVLSDMAPNTTGIREIDQASSFELVLAAFNFSRQTLKANGTFLVKAFQSQDFANLIKELRSYFRDVKILKPQASRSRSQEVFLLAQGFVLQ